MEFIDVVLITVFMDIINNEMTKTYWDLKLKKRLFK